MKTKAIVTLSIVIVIVLIAVIFSGINDPDNSVNNGGGCSHDTTQIKITQEKPLNISIYLDLSDRIKSQTYSENNLNQMDKDTAIVAFLAAVVKKRAEKQRIVACKDKIKVFFYPAPNDSKIALLSDHLEMDLSTTKAQDKKKVLMAFEDDFKTSLEQIYHSTIQSNQWPGSDIWGFFKKPIDTYCIKEDSRNVLVILTDGYIYYQPNRIQKGDSTNYILQQTLRNPKSALIPARNDLDDLEVLFLELNPNPPTDQTKMEEVISEWLKAMGVKKFYVGETDLPSNTKMIIEKFLK